MLMRNESVLSCSFFTISAILLLGGIPCWIVGALTPKYYNSDFIYSIPLYPSSEDELSVWSFQNKNATKDHHDKLIFPIDPSDFSKKNLGRKIDFYILHNLWGIKMAGKINKNENFNKFNYIKNFDQNPANLDFFSLSVYPSDLPSPLRKYGDYRVKCPFPTLITNENNIETKCNRNIGSFIHLKDLYELVKIGDIEINVGDSLSVVFDELKVFPYDFVITPQMFLLFWKKSNSSKLVLSGIILTVTGLIVLVVSIILFFACFSGSSDDAGTDLN